MAPKLRLTSHNRYVSYLDIENPPELAFLPNPIIAFMNFSIIFEFVMYYLPTFVLDI